MAIRNIVCYPDPLLRKKCEEITAIDDEIKRLGEDMLDTMYEKKGIGLAAPQVGVIKRLITVDISGPEKRENPFVMVNPEIVEKKGETEGEEGCLSLPGFKGKVKRAAAVKVRYLDLDGEEHLVDADELFAICLQHEIDHLDGKLIIDYAGRLKKKMYENKLKKLQKHRAR